jgi:hypothetical protein
MPTLKCSKLPLPTERLRGMARQVITEDAEDAEEAFLLDMQLRCGLCERLKNLDADGNRYDFEVTLDAYLRSGKYEEAIRLLAWTDGDDDVFCVNDGDAELHGYLASLRVCSDTAFVTNTLPRRWWVEPDVKYLAVHSFERAFLVALIVCRRYTDRATDLYSLVQGIRSRGVPGDSDPRAAFVQIMAREYQTRITGCPTTCAEKEHMIPRLMYAWAGREELRMNSKRAPTGSAANAPPSKRVCV